MSKFLGDNGGFQKLVELIKTALGLKVSLSNDLSFSAPAYSASNVGKYAVVLSVPTNRRLTLSISSNANGYGSSNVVYLVGGQQNSSAYQLLGDGGFAIRHDMYAGKVYLCVPCLSSQYAPRKTYHAQVLFYSESDRTEIVVPQTQTIYDGDWIDKAQTIYTAPLKDTEPFNVSSAGVGSIDLENYSSFLGKCTSDMDSVTIHVENELAGQIYNLTFDHDVTDGITIDNGGSTTYCTVSETVKAGDVITLTAASNTSNGWIYSHIGAPIESPDGSILVEISDGVTKLKVNPDKLTLPDDVLRNHSTVVSTPNDRTLAIGYGARVNTVNDMAIGRNALADLSSLAVGQNSTANNYGTTAVGQEAKATGQYGTAVGYVSKATSFHSTAVGETSEAGNRASSVGGKSFSGVYAVANGFCANAGKYKGQYGLSQLVNFSIGGTSYKVYTTSSAETLTITVDGETYELNVSANNMLFILRNGLFFVDALLFNIDGVVKQKQEVSYSVENYIDYNTKIQIGAGLFAYAFSISPNTRLDFSDINQSTSTWFYGISSNVNSYWGGVAIGSKASALGDYSEAFGHGTSAVADRQIVLGTYNLQSTTDLFQIGNGSETARRNLLVIDSNKTMKGLVGVTFEPYTLPYSTSSLGNKGIYMAPAGTYVNFDNQYAYGGRVCWVCALGNCTVQGKALQAGAMRSYIGDGGVWYEAESGGGGGSSFVESVGSLDFRSSTPPSAETIKTTVKDNTVIQVITNSQTTFNLPTGQEFNGARRVFVHGKTGGSSYTLQVTNVSAGQTGNFTLEPDVPYLLEFNSGWYVVGGVVLNEELKRMLLIQTTIGNYSETNYSHTSGSVSAQGKVQRLYKINSAPSSGGSSQSPFIDVSYNFYSKRSGGSSFNELMMDSYFNRLSPYINLDGETVSRMIEWYCKPSVLKINDTNVGAYYNSATKTLTISQPVRMVAFETTGNNYPEIEKICGIEQDGYRLTIIPNGRCYLKESTGDYRFSSRLYQYVHDNGTSSSQSTHFDEAYIEVVQYNKIWLTKTY